MFLFVGLGNPGLKYALTRHNTGFWVIDEMAARGKVNLREIAGRSCLARAKFAGREVILAKPLTFMNRSGLAARALLRHFALKPEDLLVIYDDLDLPLGRLRLRPKGGSGGHRGLASIINFLQTADFPRLRLGIGRPEVTGNGADYVLSTFTPKEEEQILKTVQTAADALETFLAQGLQEAMNRYNVQGGEGM
ncbi:MAG: aminoacyl-tRNA hydrolase [Firmicutes bacterium]|nr:aminoacyl-tRNA hydrolase [Bacillota bacterium]